MATKATTTPHAAIAAGFAINAYAMFKGYSALEEGQEQILEVGAPVRIDRFENEADIIVIGVDDEGNDIMSDDGTTPKFAERVFPEEIEAAELDPDGDTPAETVEPVAEAPVVEAAPVKPAKKAPAKKAAAAATPAAEAAPAAKPETAAAKKKRETKEAREAAAVEKAETAAANKAKGDQAKATAKAEKEAKAAAKPVKEIKATPVVEIADMTSVREILAESDALTAALSLVNRAEQTDFTLGGVLRHIHETGAFKSIGYDGKRGFDDYVRAVLGMEPRKSRYLMATYTAMALVGADEERLQSIGWSKVKELARIETAALKKNLDTLLTDAETMTRDDLIASIKKRFKVTSRGTNDGVTLTDFKFRLAEEDAAAVNEGLTEAKALVGEDDLNKAFAYIVGDWRNTGTGQDLSLEDTLELACAKFGLTAITITQADGQQVEFEPEVAAEAEAAAE
jgi:hypothetical protein